MVGIAAIDRLVDDIAEALADDGSLDASAARPIPISAKCITYGRVEHLEESLASFLQQDYAGDHELVIVDDYPLQTLHFEHPRVRIIMSGLGTDDGSRPHVVRRHADHLETLRLQGAIPTGDIELVPRLRRDYASALASYCAEHSL